MLSILIDVAHSMGVTLGVGSSTFALIFYIRSLEDGTIDATERRFLKTVFVVLRIGMFLIFVSLLGMTFVQSVTHGALVPLWIFLGVITLNAVLMARHIMPMQYGPILAGGTWYTLFFVSGTPLGGSSPLTITLFYGAVLTLVYLIFSLCKKKFTVQKGSFRGDVTTDTEVLKNYATDASCFRVMPTGVYYPRDTKDIQELVRMCYTQHTRGERASITLRAGGTCMSGGPLNDGWIVDLTKYMNRITINPEDMTATVEAGAYFRDIEDAAAQHGLMFAPYPSSHRVCGIGGMLGNNASGEKSLRYGATSDNVRELEVVLADGSLTRIGEKERNEIVDVRERELLELSERHGESMRRATGDVKKSASGYRIEKILSGETFNLVPLFVGAQGTLGIVTHAVLKLVPIPKYTELVLISGKSLKDIPKMMKTVFALNPEGLETFDRYTFEKAREHMSEHAARMLPYVDEKAHLFILAQFSEKTKAKTKTHAQACLEQLGTQGFRVEHVTKPEDVASIWEIRRHSFLLMRDHTAPHERAVPCIEDIIVPLSHIGTFILGLRAILKKRNVTYGYHGHIGDGSLRIIPVFDFRSPTVSREITGLMDDVFALVKQLNGNISADHSDGIVRSPFLKEFYGEELYSVFERIKELYDPLNIMNPHKKIGVSLTYLSEHLNREA